MIPGFGWVIRSFVDWSGSLFRRVNLRIWSITYLFSRLMEWIHRPHQEHMRSPIADLSERAPWRHGLSNANGV